MIREACTRCTALLLLLLLAAAPGSFSGCTVSDSVQGPSVDDPDRDPPDDPDPGPDSGSVSLLWDAPVVNADGSQPVDDLAGYVLCYGTSANDLSECIDVGNRRSHQVELPFGDYHFAVRAYDLWLNESVFSNVLQVTLSAPASENSKEQAEPPHDDLRGSLHLISARAQQ